LEKELLENYRNYLEKKELYKSFGYNVDKERAFIIEKAQPLFGDILEAGTGKGHFALALALQGYSFSTFDISAVEQKFARLILRHFSLEEKARFFIEDGEKLSFADQSFDVAFSVNTIHHLNSPYKFIDQLLRVLSFEGKLVLSDFTDEGFAIMERVHARQGGKHQVGKITLSDLGIYLEKKGFKLEKYRSEFQHVLVSFRQIT
jgi:SAM-dependent methyltransferase